MRANRRDFIKAAGLGLAGLYISSSFSTLRAVDVTDAPLAERVAAICRRLAPKGWRQLLLKVTGGELDLASRDLAKELAKKLTKIDRSVPGFEDFAADGCRAIEPGQPALSLLFHAFASANVQQDGNGQPLAEFPTPAEIETVENCVYGLRPPSLDELRARAGEKARLAIVVFSSEYRTARYTVHRQHADVCFSRTATARTGNTSALYDPSSRDFRPLDDQNKFNFRVLPTRFAAYVAVRKKGDKDADVPMRFQEDDDSREFWVPLHKLFPGPECIRGLALDLNYEAHFINEKLRKLHEYMEAGGYGKNSDPADRTQFPFTIRDSTIAAFTTDPAYGTGMIAPTVNPIYKKAIFKGQPIGYKVSHKFTAGDGNLWFSSLQIVPDAGDSPFKDEIAYMDGLNPESGRTAPEYINGRHELLPNGSIKNLNENPRLMDILVKGGYQAQHYIDFTGDGWVDVSCPQLESALKKTHPAYIGIAPPDFFPSITQLEMMEWWEQEAPEELRRGVWCIDPLALSDRRMAANVTLEGAKFDIDDDTVTAIVGLLDSGGRGESTRPLPAGNPGVTSRLPDASNGVFDPGWDFAQDTLKTPTGLKLYLTNYGLGTPFIEDAKLCAALGAYWPAVAPDSTRTFQPEKRPQGTYWPWPSIVPLTDEEIGSAKTEDGELLPWDGVYGPKLVQFQGRDMMRYSDIDFVDYIDLDGKLTAWLTAKIDLAEYERRTLANAAVYWAIGITDPKYFKPENWLVGPHHDQAFSADQTKALAANRQNLAKSEWAVSSFRKVVKADNTGLLAACAATHTDPDVGGPWYRFEAYRYGKQITDPGDFHYVLVEVKEPIVFFVNGQTVLMQPKEQAWQKQRAFATC